MKRFLTFLVPALFAWMPAAEGAEFVDPSTIVPPGAPKSEFVDDANTGKDPFFPKSTRRKVVVKPTEDVPVVPSIPETIALKGISFLQDRKLAIINNYTVAQGEEFTIRVNGQPMKLRCVEIKEKSAVVDFNGITKELPLRPALQ
jgi:hypothetical protein